MQGTKTLPSNGIKTLRIEIIRDIPERDLKAGDVGFIYQPEQPLENHIPVWGHFTAPVDPNDDPSDIKWRSSVALSADYFKVIAEISC
jgi:hypothetical protein